MVVPKSLSPAPLGDVRHRSWAAFLLALGLRLVLAAALVGVLAGLLEAALWEPRAPAEEPVVEVCSEPPCLPESLPDLRHLPIVVPPLGYLLAALLGVTALVVSLGSGRARGRRAAVLAALGPVAVLVAMEVVPHLVNPCLVAAAASEHLPSGCARTVHGVDVHDRWHALHHAVVGGVPATVAYAGLLRRRRPELFAARVRAPVLPARRPPAVEAHRPSAGVERVRGGEGPGMDVDVKHLPEQGRFEAEVEGSTAFLTYEREGGTVAMTHTVVPPPIEGRGVAAELTSTAVEWARSEGLQIDPQCSYVRAWLRRNG